MKMVITDYKIKYGLMDWEQRHRIQAEIEKNGHSPILCPNKLTFPTHLILSSTIVLGISIIAIIYTEFFLNLYL